jgi:hypothetical protein
VTKKSDRELLELFAAFLDEVEKPERDPSKFDQLKTELRSNLGDFPLRFADGAEKILQELEASQIPS